MNIFIPTAIALVAYIVSIVLVLPAILESKRHYRLLLWMTTAIALVAHAVFLHTRVIPTTGNLQLSLLNIGSAISLFLCAASVSMVSQNRGWQLLPIALSFALINLVLTAFLPNQFTSQLESTVILLAHIGLALLAFSTLFIASLYATFLAWINYRLKHKNLPLGNQIPPLLQIERRLFVITYIGFAFLSITLLIGFIYLPEPLGIHNLHKTLLSSAAWLVYLVLLIGHFSLGWRGIRSVRISYLGIILLSLAYVGNRLIIGY